MKNKGIYYLLNDDKIVYIGKSLSNMKTRVDSHLKDEAKEFDSVLYHSIDNDSDINILEVAMIAKHSPIYNNDCVTSDNSTIDNLNIEDFTAEARLVVYQINLANTQGMKNMKYNDLSTIGETIIKSNLDAKMFFFIIRHQSLNSMLKKSYGTDLATTSYIAKKFDVTPQKVRGFIRECIEQKLLKKLSKNFIVNPYIIAPYMIKNNQLHQLQLWWDSNPKSMLTFEDDINIDEFEKESIQKIYNSVSGAPDEK